MSQPQLDDRGIPTDYMFKDDWEVTPRETREALASGRDDVLVLDVRRDDELAIAKIEGAAHVPLHELQMRLDDLRDDHAGKRVITVCHHGRRSLQAAAILRAGGFEDVKSMAGGIDLWSMDIDPAVPRY